jgi:hypothetical protein
MSTCGLELQSASTTRLAKIRYGLWNCNENCRKSFKELSARQNSIARSLWMAKTNACIAQTFNDDEVYDEHLFKKNLPVFCIVCCMLINKLIFMSSLVFKLSIRLLLLFPISPIHRSRKLSSLHLGSENFDVFSSLLCSVVLVSERLWISDYLDSWHSRAHVK